MRSKIGCFVAALLLCGAAGAATSLTPIDFGTPPPAIETTARLALTSGPGVERVAAWTAANSRRGLCVGFRTGPASTAPKTLTCLRQGLEPPLIQFESGGGAGGVATWGVITGLVSPDVSSVVAETLFGTRTTTTLRLRPLPTRPGWHSFTTGVLEHPTSTALELYDPAGDIVAYGSGAIIHPNGPPTGAITPPGQTPTGPAWSDAATNLIPRDPATQRTISLALADPTVRAIIATHAAWLDNVSSWANCNGRRLGGIAVLMFKAPATFTETVPEVRPPAGQASYSVVVQNIAATDWNRMAVWVDTSSAAVVGIDTRGEPRVDYSLTTTGNETNVLSTVMPPRDAGGPDSGSCWSAGD